MLSLFRLPYWVEVSIVERELAIRNWNLLGVRKLWSETWEKEEFDHKEEEEQLGEVDTKQEGVHEGEADCGSGRRQLCVVGVW